MIIRQVYRHLSFTQKKIVGLLGSWPWVAMPQQRRHRRLGAEFQRTGVVLFCAGSSSGSHSFDRNQAAATEPPPQSMAWLTSAENQTPLYYPYRHILYVINNNTKITLVAFFIFIQCCTLESLDLVNVGVASVLFSW